jgi:hypothetical protein
MAFFSWRAEAGYNAFREPQVDMEAPPFREGCKFFEK